MGYDPLSNMTDAEIINYCKDTLRIYKYKNWPSSTNLSASDEAIIDRAKDMLQAAERRLNQVKIDAYVRNGR